MGVQQAGPLLRIVSPNRVPDLPSISSKVVLFLEQVAIETGTEACWNWTGDLDAKGYARVTDRDSGHRAYRLAYKLFVGPIPEGLVIDHLCRNRACVKPDHLEAVTNAENSRRIPKEWRACDKWHPGVASRIKLRPSNGTPACSECDRYRRAHKREHGGETEPETPATVAVEPVLEPLPPAELPEPPPPPVRTWVIVSDRFEDRDAVLEPLISARLAAGVSAREMSRRMSVSDATVRRLEAEGSDPTVSLVQRYAGALGFRLVLDLKASDEK